MADTAIAITAGSGTNVDTRTEATNGNHRQVIVIGDPATNAGVAPVDATAGLKVDLGADNDITGTVTANLSATDNAVLDAIAADTTTIAGDTTSIDAKIPALGQALAAASVPVVLTASQLTTLTPPAAISGFATAAKQDTIIGHVDGVETLLGTIDADTSALAGAVAGTEMQVDVVSSALPTGASTAAKQPALGTAGTASTDVLTVQGIASMTALKVDGSGVTQPVSGTVAVTNAGITTIAGAVSGTEMQVDVVGALPAGTNAIGKLAANSGVDIGDVDVTSLPALAAGTNAIGKLLPPDIDVTAHTNYARKYYTSAGAATDGIIWSPAAGKRWHVTTLYLNVSAAATVTLEDDKSGGDDPVWKGELAANSGVVLQFTEKYPMASGEDAADLTITTTAGNVYVTCVGYEV